MSIDPRKRMPVEELRLTPEFQRLTPKQQLFVATYCGGGAADGVYDAIHATRTAYACKSPEVARIMSYSLLQNIRIVAILNRHFNREPIEDFLVILDRAIQNKKLTVAQIQALKLKCEIMGFANRLPDGNHIGVVPPDVLEASKEARKAKRKSPEKAPKPDPKSQFDDY
jgi:hypothetical protein